MLYYNFAIKWQRDSLRCRLSDEEKEVVEEEEERCPNAIIQLKFFIKKDLLPYSL